MNIDNLYIFCYNIQKSDGAISTLQGVSLILIR